jgi:hypothetical protein
VAFCLPEAVSAVLKTGTLVCRATNIATFSAVGAEDVSPERKRWEVVENKIQRQRCGTICRRESLQELSHHMLQSVTHYTKLISGSANVAPASLTALPST